MEELKLSEIEAELVRLAAEKREVQLKAAELAFARSLLPLRKILGIPEEATVNFRTREDGSVVAEFEGRDGTPTS